MNAVGIILLGSMVDYNARVSDGAVLGNTPDFVMGEKKDSVSGNGDTFLLGGPGEEFPIKCFFLA